MQEFTEPLGVRMRREAQESPRGQRPVPRALTCGSTSLSMKGLWITKAAGRTDSWKDVPYKDRALPRLPRLCLKSGLCSF